MMRWLVRLVVREAVENNPVIDEFLIFDYKAKEYFAVIVRELYKKYHGAFFVVGAPNDREYADEVIAAC